MIRSGPRALRRRLFPALSVAALLCSPSARAGEVPEPDGYRLDAYRAPTPATLEGASVLDVGAARAVHARGEAVFIDVMPRPPKPANLPPGTIWRDTPRQSLPGALCLPNVGFGALSTQAEAYFGDGLAAASGRDRRKPLVFFCERDCWMSWNAAKRALGLGYTAVSWFPDGTDGWAEAGLPRVPVEPWGGGIPAR